MAAASAGEKKKNLRGGPSCLVRRGSTSGKQQQLFALAACCAACSIAAWHLRTLFAGQAARWRKGGSVWACVCCQLSGSDGQTCSPSVLFGARTVENSVPERLIRFELQAEACRSKEKRLFLEICLRKRRLCNCTVEEVCKQYYRGAARLLARGWMSSVSLFFFFYPLLAVCVIHPTG